MTEPIPEWVKDSTLLAESLSDSRWSGALARVEDFAAASSAWEQAASARLDALASVWSGAAISAEDVASLALEQAAARLAQSMKTPESAETFARLAESMRTSTWRQSTLQFAESMKISVDWAETSDLLEDFAATSAWGQTSTLLEDLAQNSAWTESVAAFTAALEDPAWTEEFVAAAGIESVPPAEEAEPTKVLTDAVERKRKQGIGLTVAAYLAAAVALHLSNYMTTPDPVFDPHQFITDEFLAIGLALALYCAFWKA
jgi:hypothetical protein